MLSLLGALDIHGPYKASLNIIGPFACEGPLAGSVEKNVCSTVAHQVPKHDT